MRPIFRFAPSTNGHLHLGHAYSVLLIQKIAKKTDGKILLRIEDIDKERCGTEFEDALLEDLEWLGIKWEEPVLRQSDQMDTYWQALKKLSKLGLIYAAPASRSEISRATQSSELEGIAVLRDPDGAPHYPYSARDRLNQELIAGCPVRLNIEKSLEQTGPLNWHETGRGPNGQSGKVVSNAEDWGDVMLARKDVPTSYHLSSVLDDALQGITHVIRGRDLFFATSIHRVLQEVLNLPEPLYHHHAILTDENGKKLSKSLKSISLKEMRDAGKSASDIRTYLGFDPV
jgi:glutamyl-Q tRNA(Asp) synthetase